MNRKPELERSTGKQEELEVKRLAAELKTVRQGKGLSRHAVARPAKISAAYLQKIEAGVVKSPSPRILHRLAEVLGLSYARLMELTGYELPGYDDSGKGEVTGVQRPDSALRALIARSDLSRGESRAVSAFIRYLLEQR